jgi:hypothetical protein
MARQRENGASCSINRAAPSTTETPPIVLHFNAIRHLANPGKSPFLILKELELEWSNIP